MQGVPRSAWAAGQLSRGECGLVTPGHLSAKSKWPHVLSVLSTNTKNVDAETLYVTCWLLLWFCTACWIEWPQGKGNVYTGWLNSPPECSFHKARQGLCAHSALEFGCLSDYGQNTEKRIIKWQWLSLNCFSNHCVWRKFVCSNKKTWNGYIVAFLKTDFRHCFYASWACVLHPGDHKNIMVLDKFWEAQALQ